MINKSFFDFWNEKEINNLSINQKNNNIYYKKERENSTVRYISI